MDGNSKLRTQHQKLPVAQRGLDLRLIYTYTENPMSAPQLTPAPQQAARLQAELPGELRNSLFRASDLIRKRRTELREAPLPTSLNVFDRLLGGGLQRGGLVEFIGRGSCGRFAAIMAALRAVTGAGEAAAFVDQGAQLDPQSAAEIGVDLERLLWLRPQNLGDSLAAAELLLHTGFPLVTLDLGLPPVRGRAPLAAWLRLARSAATHGSVILVGSPYRLSGCAAGAVVVGGRGRGDWNNGGASRLLTGLSARLSLARRIGHSNDANELLALTHPEATFGPNLQHEAEEKLCGKSEIRNSKSEIPRERKEEHVTAI